jgi:hypothetical protein
MVDVCMSQQDYLILFLRSFLRINKKKYHIVKYFSKSTGMLKKYLLYHWLLMLLFAFFWSEKCTYVKSSRLNINKILVAHLLLYCRIYFERWNVLTSHEGRKNLWLDTTSSNTYKNIFDWTIIPCSSPAFLLLLCREKGKVKRWHVYKLGVTCTGTKFVTFFIMCYITMYQILLMCHSDNNQQMKEGRTMMSKWHDAVIVHGYLH